MTNVSRDSIYKCHQHWALLLSVTPYLYEIFLGHSLKKTKLLLFWIFSKQILDINLLEEWILLNVLISLTEFVQVVAINRHGISEIFGKLNLFTEIQIQFKIEDLNNKSTVSQIRWIVAIEAFLLKLQMGWFGTRNYLFQFCEPFTTWKWSTLLFKS